MCISPNNLGDGTQVACRKCWQCNYVRVDDLVGRCIAESKTAVATHVVTLTYGRDPAKDSVSYGEAEHPKAVLLTYSDVQLFLKTLRNDGYPARYLVSGEYGSAKGRAHWHICLFWTKAVPPLPKLRVNAFDHVRANGKPWWPHGFTFWDVASAQSFRYALKYVLKETGQGANEAQYKKQQSRMPPLGAAYFAQLARKYAEAGLAPQANSTAPEPGDDGWSIGKFAYSFPEAVRKNGSKKIEFHLANRSEELFLEAYCEAWRELHGDKPMPHSKLVQEYLEPGVWKKSEGDSRSDGIYAPPLTGAEIAAVEAGPPEITKTAEQHLWERWLRDDSKESQLAWMLEAEKSGTLTKKIRINPRTGQRRLAFYWRNADGSTGSFFAKTGWEEF